jgi:hypothetical protein
LVEYLDTYDAVLQVLAASEKIYSETGVFSSLYLGQEISTKLCTMCNDFAVNLSGCLELSVPITLIGGEESVALETLLWRYFQEDHGTMSAQLDCEVCDKVLDLLLFLP